MRVHINVLYSIVIILLILQIFSFISISSQTSKIISDQEKTRKNFEESINELRNDNQFKFNEIVEVLAQQKKDFELEIEFLKSSQVDFSGVIEQVIKGVVSVRTDKSAASGFIVDHIGYVITNYHVIEGSSFVKVQTYDGETYDAEVIGKDPLTDLALLKITGFFNKVELANSSKIQVGEKVIAIGNPLGLSFTVTEGIVSGLKRTGPNGLENYVQTDVTLNPGNSGGPLINRDGEVIGVNNFKIGGAEGLGFALESNMIKEKVNKFANKTIVE